jgi:hypothetical protein
MGAKSIGNFPVSYSISKSRFEEIFMRKYAILVTGGIEPELAGPFDTITERDQAAKKFRNSDEDNIAFWLNITEKGVPTVGSYSGLFMDDHDGING